jgi:hypothetical protein
VDLLVVLAELRPEPSHRARHPGQPRHDGRDRERAQLAVGQVQDGLPRPELRVIEHVAGLVDPAGRDAGVREHLQQRLGAERAGPGGHDAVHLGLPLAAGFGRGVPLIGREVRSSHRGRQAAEHGVPVGPDQDLAAVGGRVDIRGRHAGRACRASTAPSAAKVAARESPNEVPVRGRLYATFGPPSKEVALFSVIHGHDLDRLYALSGQPAGASIG